MLNQKTTLLVTGASRLGKSEYLKLRGFQLSMSLLGDAAKLITLRTMDRCKDFEMGPGSVLLLDEQDPADAEQTIYSSAGVWMNLLEVGQTTGFRSRNTDASLARGVLRMVGATNQYTTAEGFVDAITRVPEQHAAALNRIFHVHVTERLFVHGTAAAAALPLMPAQLNPELVDARLSELLG